MSDARDAGFVEPLQLPVVWVGVDEAPLLSVNQFIGQIEPGVAFLTVGQVTPPVLMGTPEEVDLQVQQLRFVPVRTVARFALTRPRLQELIGLLQSTLTNLDSIPSGEAP